MVGALGYPFGLFGRRLVSSTFGFLLLVLILAAIDVVFAMGGQDTVNTSPFGTSRNGASQFYNLITTIISVFAAAMVMATALIDLKRRDQEERPSLADGISQIVLNFKYGFTVLLPTVLIFLVEAGGMGAWAQRGGASAALTAPWIGIAVGTIVFLAAIYVSVRLFIAWPMAVSDGEAKLWRAWPASRRKFWPLLGLIFLVYIIGLLPVVVVGGALGGLGITPDYPVTSLNAALTPRAIVSVAAQDVGLTFTTFYTSAAAAFLYNAVDPSKINVADVF